MIKIDSIPLYETLDLKVFKNISENRKQNNIQVNKLARAMRNGENITKVSPILVNEKYEIIDGQHRVWAVQKLTKEGMKLPIYFMVRAGLSASDAMKLNAGSKPWNPDDYANYHSTKGNENYKVYLHFKNRYGLNADVLIKYLQPKEGNRVDFQNGDFKVTSENKSKTWCNRLESMEIYFRDYTHRSFALAFLDLVSHPNYNHERMIHQLEKHSADLIRIPLKNKPMREALIEIYNNRVQQKELFN